MNYPEGEMKFVSDGRGTRGPSAECRISETEIRLRPIRVFRAVIGWPELVLRVKDVRGVETMFFGRYRFRSNNQLIDGACFRPIDPAKSTLVAALDVIGIPSLQSSTREKLFFELRTIRNQIRWGGRGRRRHWKREQYESP
jgi:hypothetical protein